MKNRDIKNGPAWFSLHSFRFRALGLKGKLIIALVPALVLVLACTGILTYEVSEEYISIALERNVILRDRAMAREMELFLDRCRRDVLFLAEGDTSPASMRRTFERMVHTGDCPYFEIGFVPAEGDGFVRFVRTGDEVRFAPAFSGLTGEANPALYLDQLKSMKPGHVRISDIIEVQCTVPEPGVDNRVLGKQVVRLVTPSGRKGMVFLSISATRLRDILSLYNSERSPLWAFPRSDEVRYAYAVDKDGWMLFQSGDEGEAAALETFTARKGFDGTLGRSGHGSAFRPSDLHGDYWEIIEKIRNREFGKKTVNTDLVGFGSDPGYFLAYSPVFFRPDGKTPEVYAGIMYIDRSRLPIVAGYRYLDVMFFVCIVTIVFITFFVYFMGRMLTDPIRILAQRMELFRSPDELEEINLGYHGRDLEMLAGSINRIIRMVRRQLVEIQRKDEEILSVNRRERAELDMHEVVLEESRMSLIPEIVGTGPVVAELKSRIFKAAQTDVDVLVIGETGTGKQLVAEAVHKLSNRKDGPFISINCGALDENLLLDALFGHVKGAFTEARADRNGAFSEANGGTLFLDEIQVASPKVQQSLLRALSMRRIKPLGSDTEISVNVRIIAATNVNLTEMIERNAFREDLYYRLKVLSINTPALRDHPESIPVLALCYLHQAETLVNRTDLGFSNGALYKLSKYHWPGNVRELVNCVTRAAVMAEGDIIQDEEIKLEGELPEPGSVSSVQSTEADDAQSRNEPREESFESGEDRFGRSGVSETGPDEREFGAGDIESGEVRTEGVEPDRSRADRRFEDHDSDLSASGRKARESDHLGRNSFPQQARSESRKTEVPVHGRRPHPDLNERQLKGWRLLLTEGSLTRSRYQKENGNIPSRTAIHDLQGMIQLGVIVKTGKGPATRYEPVRRP